MIICTKASVSNLQAIALQAVLIQQRNGLAPDSKPITLGETPASQLVLSERRISYRIPAKTRYPTKIKKCLDGEKPYALAVTLYTLTNCTAILWSGSSFFFDAAGGFIRECSDSLPVYLNGKIKDLLKETPTIPGVSAYIGDNFNSHNYCHWILDWLPRLSLCEHAGPFDNSVGIASGPDFMRESLAFLGY